MASKMDSTQLAQLVAKVLKEELREDENTREQSLEQFRDWILKNPDIQNCPTDDSFLLPYLRAKKYSVPTAEKTLMRLIKLQHNFPELTSNLDIEDPDLNDAISSGILFFSPIPDNSGRTVLVFIANNQDINKHGYQTAVRTYFLNIYSIYRRESALVLGVTAVLDYSNLSAAYLALFPIATLKTFFESMETAFPIRIKEVHIVNLPSFATWFLNIVLKFLSEKLRSRVFFHSSLEELHKHVDPSVLPKEQGGTMPMAEMIGLWKKELAVHREAVLATNNIKLVGDSFKNDFGSNETGNPDLQGSFRKLAVD